MSQLLSTLGTEHAHILRVITALHDFAAFHVHDDPAGRAVVGEFVTYLREYVDGWHHHKEEDVLFVAMERAGMSREIGPVACMLHEHDVGRSHVQMLAELAAGEGALTPREHGVLAHAVAGYVYLLASHIAKEDNMLYPMARRRIPAAELAALDEAVAGDPVDTGRRLEALGDTLIARYAAARFASGPGDDGGDRCPPPPAGG